MLQLRAVTKEFGSFKALDSVDFAVRPGEIVALLGENGAGKSTLMNLVGGVLTPTSGELLWHDAPTRLRSPREATALGIGVVHQHFMLVPVFTVAENIALHGGRGKLYKAKVWEERVRAWADSLGWKIDPARRVQDLSVGERQRVEILKALFAGAGETTGQSADAAKLLLLDEPTANLTPGETEELFEVLRRLRGQGRGIVFVSHKLNEVLALCDRVVVLRHGKVVGERIVSETNAADLATLMVGRSLETVTETPRTPGPPRLRLQNLSLGKLHDFSLTVHAGEIAGLAGVDGNGQAELLDLLSGLSEPATGALELLGDDGEVIPTSSDLAVIPPDRQREGLILTFDLAENLALHPALRVTCRRRFAFDWAGARQQTRALMQRFDVRAPATAERSLAANLSGGNQQKVVIARALSFAPRIVVAADPTRGLDVGAAAFVHEQLRAAAESGVAVLLVSTDLDEVLSLSDRIGALYEGRLLPSPELLPRGAERERIGALMGGDTASLPNLASAAVAS